MRRLTRFLSSLVDKFVAWTDYFLPKAQTALYSNFDKVLHFTAGLLLALPCFLSLWFILLPFSVGILKEFRDYKSYGRFDPLDMLATWLGASFVIWFILLRDVLGFMYK